MNERHSGRVSGPADGTFDAMQPSSVRRHSRTVAVLSVSVILLSSCGTGADQPSDRSAIPVVTSSSTPVPEGADQQVSTFPIDDIEPSTPLPTELVDGTTTANDTTTTSPSTSTSPDVSRPVGKDAPEDPSNSPDGQGVAAGRGTPPTHSDPEPEQYGTEPDGNLPANFTLPAGAELFAPASKLDGDSSYLVLQSGSRWQDFTSSTRSALEQAGWSCFSCLPFEGRETSKGTAAWRYLLNMRQGERLLVAVISELPGGRSQVDVNFSAGR